MFRQGRSRETSYAKDYDRLVELLRHEKDHGNIVWVMGPAFAFDDGARKAMQALIDNGYCHGLLAGNALATHDLEGSLLHTALGQDIYTQESRPNGHYHHIDVINAARAAGSIPAFIEQNGIRDGIMHACVAHGVPYVLAGSIRDDGPLPGVYGDVYAAQNAMRELVQQATTVICVATQLHTIATGNMTPSYCVRGGRVRPVYLYCVDVSEFVTNKLRDRGSLSSVPIVANAQDFLCRVARGKALRMHQNALAAIVRAAQHHAVALHKIAELHNAQFPVRGQNRHAVHTAFFSKTPHAVHFIIFRIHACGMIARRRGAVRRGRRRAHAGRIL